MRIEDKCMLQKAALQVCYKTQNVPLYRFVQNAHAVTMLYHCKYQRGILIASRAEYTSVKSSRLHVLLASREEYTSVMTSRLQDLLSSRAEYTSAKSSRLHDLLASRAEYTSAKTSRLQDLPASSNRFNPCADPLEKQIAFYGSIQYQDHRKIA